MAAPRRLSGDGAVPSFARSRRITPEAAVALLIALSAAGRVLIAGTTGLCFGESYYFSCALHPSLSYFDHPPLSILLGRLGLELGAEPGRLVLRAPFIALFAGTTWLLFLLGRRLFGAWAGFFAALLVNLSPIFTLSVGTFFQPEGPLMFFWAACAWCLAHVLVGAPSHRAVGWWAAAGAMLGLGMLSKYAMGLLVAGAGLYVLTQKEQRHWLAHPGPYVALAVALCLFSPVILWNARHQWVSFFFQSTRGVEDFAGIRPDWLLKNIAGQAIAILPWVWAGLVAVLVTGFGRRPPQPERRFIAWLSVTPIVLFSGVAAWSSTSQHHFHWATPGYLLLFLPLGETLHRGLARGSHFYRWALGATAGVALVAIIVMTTHVATGWLQDLPVLSRLLTGIEDPTYECVDMTGLERAFAERGLLDRQDVFVFSDWWFRAGKVDYALKGRLPVLAFTRSDPRGFAFFHRAEEFLGKDGILVTTKNPAEVTGRFERYFERITPLGQVAVGRRGRAEYTLYLYRGEILKTPYPQPYG
jgi:hypothetical protein